MSDHETREQMRKVISDTSPRYHVEGTDIHNPEEDDWYFLGAARALRSVSSMTTSAETIANKYAHQYRRVRIVDTRAEED